MPEEKTILKMKEPIKILIDFSDQENTNKVHIIRQDYAIIDYLLDTKKSHIIEAWDNQNKETNTGISMFFNKEDYNNLVVIINSKFLEYNEEKGIWALIVEESHKNEMGINILKKIIEMITEQERDPLICKKINHQIDEKVNMAINFHARI